MARSSRCMTCAPSYATRWPDIRMSLTHGSQVNAARPARRKYRKGSTLLHQNGDGGGLMARWFCTTVAVVGLLAVATSASAECAWVLWLEDSRWSTTNLPFHEWNLVGGHPSKDACESKIAERLISSA